MMFKIQPAAYTDQIKDGHQMTKLPYPFYADEDGTIGQQDLWQGDPSRVIGFQRDLAKNQIDLWWADAVKNTDQVVGMYLVTEDKAGHYGVHQTAITSIEEYS